MRNKSLIFRNANCDTMILVRNYANINIDDGHATPHIISLLGVNTNLKDKDGNTIDIIREYYIKTDKELEELYKERRTKLS